MKLYQDYIFDLYGTLVDIRTDEEQQGLWDKMSQLYGGYGAVYTPEELHALYKKTVAEKEERAEEKSVSYPEISIEDVFRELYEAEGIVPSEELVTHTGQFFRVLSTRHIRLYAGAGELLRRLRERGRGVYLLSNAQRVFTERELRLLQIKDCFDGILISSDCGVKKPDEKFFHILLEK